jgi:hypothetical protein
MENGQLFPATLDDDAAWIELFNLAWRERHLDRAERVGRMLMLKSPERSDFALALQQVRSQSGEIDAWPAPQITLYLSPNNGRAVLLKRWYEALRLFRDGEVERSVPIFRRIAAALPSEAPFAFGINLRARAETLEILNAECRTHRFWNPVGEPGDTGPPFTILVSGNKSYLDRHLADFLDSAASGCPGAHIHIHVCDPKAEPATQLDSARSRHPALRITASWSDGGDLTRPAYFACARYMIAPHLLRGTKAPVLIVDIDAALKRDPGQYMPLLADIDIGLAITRGANHWNTVKAGFHWLAPSEAGTRFATGVANYLEAALSAGECCWTVDQTALWAAYHNIEAFCPDARITNLYATSTASGGDVNLAEELVAQLRVSRQRTMDRARARAARGSGTRE